MTDYTAAYITHHSELWNANIHMHPIIYRACGRENSLFEVLAKAVIFAYNDTYPDLESMEATIRFAALHHHPEYSPYEPSKSYRPQCASLFVEDNIERVPAETIAKGIVKHIGAGTLDFIGRESQWMRDDGEYVVYGDIFVVTARLTLKGRSND